jgi:hypothetical protein
MLRFSVGDITATLSSQDTFKIFLILSRKYTGR